MSDSSNVLAGSGILRLAPIGTSLPDLTDLDANFKVIWPVAWVAPGYTDDGVEITYTPNFKDLMVDEEMAAVKQLLTGEKMEVKVKLAEATLANLHYAIAGSTLEDPTAGNAENATLYIGSPTQSQIKEYMLGFEGPAPGTNQTRVVLAYRAKVIAAVSQKYKKDDKVIFDVTFSLLADSTQAAGQRLCKIVDFNSSAS